MKKSEIEVGGHYTAKVSNKLTTVRVDAIRETTHFDKPTTVYDVTNLATNRKTTFRSAAKFRCSAKAPTTLALDLVENNLADKQPSEPQQPSSKFPPTEEQQTILDTATTGTPVIMIEAGAGTGKTTTDRMLVDVLPGRGQYTAFNKSLVVDSSSKFQGTPCDCNTTHSLAFRAIGKNYADRLGGNRVRSEQIARMLAIKPYTLRMGTDKDGKPINKVLAPGYLAGQVMAALRKYCQSADQEISEDHFCYIDGIDQPEEGGKRTYANNDKVRSYLVPFAQKAWQDIADPNGQLPFSHDYYVKLWQLDNPVISADYILLDEAQDTAPVMLDILAQQIGPDREHPPQVILVGDSAQQIYEWRGAVNALAAFPEAPRCYLSQSFRCGQAIAEVANAVLETLEEATPLRLRGFEKINSRIITNPDNQQQPTAVLTRTNAVAISTLLGAIADGRHPYLVGGGSQVIAFVKAALTLQQGNSTNHPDLACFTSWGEVREYSALDEGEDLQLMVKLIDTFGCEVILEALDEMPDEKNADLVISTAHKSKGREWQHVLLAADFPTRSKCTDADRKLLYVAVTRAQEVLDVSGCPYFTGDDSLDVSHVISSTKPANGSDKPLLPSTPSKQVGQFTWRKYNDAWCVQGPANSAGMTVEVYRKDGSCQRKTIRQELRVFDNCTVYSI